MTGSFELYYILKGIDSKQVAIKNICKYQRENVCMQSEKISTNYHIIIFKESTFYFNNLNITVIF